MLYFSQAIGLALGLSAEQLGIDAHAVGISRILKKMEVAAAANAVEGDAA